MKTFDETPVVGVGASAGGLEALREMFEGFNGKPGLAFVVVQHLDPTHESLMAQLIERYTIMDVRQAKGGERIRANNVYIIPPGHGLAIEDGKLQLTEFTDPRGMRRPIDDFFHSLAVECTGMSACVILSGTGADGSRGLRAIKEHGGLALAQEPETARYDGMPVSAVSTGLIDIIAPPGDIIRHLREFFDRAPAINSLLEEANEVLDHVDELCDILQDVIGHDFSGYKRPTLTRRIARRMQVLGIEDPQAYVARVQGDASECDALFRDLLINVTRFFRDKTEFETLKALVIDPLISQSRNGQDLRVWVPGCSSGEEAYTIAMMFTEAMRQFDVRPYLQVFATDIDVGMLAIAREATYPLSALSDIPVDYRENYTVTGMSNFTISPRIRDMVRFSEHNLVRDPPFSGIDLVSCRNLLIYFDDTLQRQVFPVFHFALRKETGTLFLGSSESIGRFDDLFATIDQPSRLFRRKDTKSRYALHPTPKRTARTGRKPALVSTVDDRPRVNSIELTAMSRIAENYGPVALLVDADGNLLEKWGKAGKFLEFPSRFERQMHVPSLARPGLREFVGPLLRSVADKGTREGIRDVQVRTEFGTLSATLVCEPIENNAFLLVLRENGSIQPRDDVAFEEFDAGDSQLRFLEDELQTTRHRLRSAFEELETSNEELKSSNEEMMSMNEELQSTNEELTTVNDELKSKIDQISVANADLTNFFNSTDIAMLMVDGDLRLRSYTAAAVAVFTVDDRDIGRRLPELLTSLESNAYVNMAAGATRDGKIGEMRMSASDGREYLIRSYPYRHSDGDVEGATLVMTDMTKVLQLEEDLRAEQQRLRLALQVANVGIWEYEPSTDKTILDAKERDLLGLPADDDGAAMEPILARLPSEDRDRINLALRRAMDGKQDFDEIFRLPLADGSTRWLHGLGRRIAAGEAHKFIGVTFDITPERELLAQRELLIREMNHRVNNHFAVMLGMISISAREAEDVKTLAADLRRRIGALGRSHALTTNKSEADGASVRSLIDAVLAPSISSQTLSIDGVDVTIPLAGISSLALILHEWATNSTKYGALSVSDGALHISWESDGDDIVVTWTEFGRATEFPPSSGLGTTLIDAAALQLKGEATGLPTDDGYARTLRLPFGA